MQSSLVFSDIQKFIDKYTRFMTKDVYISYDMNQSFLKGYDYLKVELEKNQYLYQERSEYKKFFRIMRHSDEMLRLHNEKYLKNALGDYDAFFDTLGYRDVLDKNKRMMVLASEKDMVLVMGKNYIPFIVSKIKYMNEMLKYDFKRICVLVSDDKDLELLKREMSIYEMDVSLYGLREYGLSLFQKNESILDENVLYDDLVHYMLEMFLDKERFSSFYSVFSSYIYLNRDYKDFDTFPDYHAYMYKRMFLESKLSLKKFIEREIKKRRSYFQSIDNYFFDSKEMVDIANFLYLNSISYVYDEDKKCFVCDGKDSISFLDGNSIVLDRKSKFLESLVYELVKRQYGMERRSDDEVYAMLRSSTVDSYFSELIRDKLIPNFYYYEENHSFDGTLFDDKQRIELEKMYEYYVSFKKEKHYLSDFDVHERVQSKIRSEKYDYFIMLGNSSYIFPKSHLVILKEYPRVDLIKSNLRFFYDYKSFLNEKRCLAVSHGYLSMDELYKLTSMFLSSNLSYLNGQIVHSKRRICVCFYEEENRFQWFKNLSLEILRVLSSDRDKKFCFSLDKRMMKYLINSGFFVRGDGNCLECEYGYVSVGDVRNIKKRFDSIVFPFLIRDCYHEVTSIDDEIYRVKMMLFMAVSKCKDSVYLMCPKSKKDKYMEVFKNLNVEYYF